MVYDRKPHPVVVVASKIGVVVYANIKKKSKGVKFSNVKNSKILQLCHGLLVAFCRKPRYVNTGSRPRKPYVFKPPCFHKFTTSVYMDSLIFPVYMYSCTIRYGRTKFST
eukprot:SAG31_NODE_273_length_18667_cov_3.603619_15_plen_110_part_00